jgi:putative hydrolase of the HAD superfamily
MKIWIKVNIKKETANYLRRLPFYQDISGDVFSCDYNTIKPNRDIYNILLDKYDLIPEKCLFIDDNQNNINTAIELGFKVIKVESGNFSNLIMELNKYIKKYWIGEVDNLHLRK